MSENFEFQLPEPEMIFDNYENALETAKNMAVENGFCLTIKNSKRDKNGGYYMVYLKCDRGGVYRNRHNIDENSRIKGAGSKLINCPFEMKISHIENTWKLVIKNGNHNHPPSEDINVHSTVRKLDRNSIDLVEQMINSGSVPKTIVSTVNGQGSSIISRDIYNCKRTIRRNNLNGRTPIQALVDELDTNDFIYNLKYDETGSITHLFFAPKITVKLTKKFSSVLLMDCTYKTNRFRMPLLNVVGISSTNKSFFSCFAFLKSETMNDYSWALDEIKKIFNDSDMPHVIVTDRELALMNSIKLVFPSTKNLICLWHVNKNITANCKKLFNTEQEWENFLELWYILVSSDSLESYNLNLNTLKSRYQNKHTLINYIVTVWLPYKEMFIKYWTNDAMHFGSTVTSRVEGAHSQLKSYLNVSTGDLLDVKQKILLVVKKQHLEISASIENDKIRVNHELRIPFFSDVVGKISTFILKKVFIEYKSAVNTNVENITSCNNVWTRTFGIPCRHIIKNMISQNLKLSRENFHKHWWLDRNNNEIINNEESNQDLTTCLTRILTESVNWPTYLKNHFCKGILSLEDRLKVHLKNPSITQTRGRPSGSNNILDNSTRRELSAFEYVEENTRPRRCGICGSIGHNSRTCNNSN
jgi:MULE transposase domain